MWLQRHGARRHKQCSSHITLLQVTRALQTILQTPPPQPREGSFSAALCSPVQVNWVNHRSSSSSPNFGIPEFHESTRVRRDQCPDCPPSTWECSSVHTWHVTRASQSARSAASAWWSGDGVRKDTICSMSRSSDHWPSIYRGQGHWPMMCCHTRSMWTLWTVDLRNPAPAAAVARSRGWWDGLMSPRPAAAAAAGHQLLVCPGCGRVPASSPAWPGSVAARPARRQHVATAYINISDGSQSQSINKS